MSQPHVVVFEVTLNPARADEYLHIAAELRPELLDMEGFLGNERFRSRTRPDTLLSLSLWADEQALIGWRHVQKHREAQWQGRHGVFADYRLRVGAIKRSADHAFGETTRADGDRGGGALVIVEGQWLPRSPQAQWMESVRDTDVAEMEVYDHLTTQGHIAVVLDWRHAAAAHAFADSVANLHQPDSRIYVIQVIRDHGLMDRHEAPEL